MTVLESAPSFSNPEADSPAAIGRFFIIKPSDEYAFQLAAKFPAITAASRAAQTELLEHENDNSLPVYGRMVEAYVKGRADDNTKALLGQLGILRAAAAGYYDAGAAIRKVARPVAQQLTAIVKQAGNLLSISSNPYWIEFDTRSGAEHLCTTDETSEPIIYFGQVPEGAKTGSRPATIDECAQLLRDCQMLAAPPAG